MRIRTWLVAMVGLVLCWPAFGQTSIGQTSIGQTSIGQTSTLRAERELFASINQTRRGLGLPALRWDESLATAARRHAVVMAEHGSAQHGFPGEPSLSMRAKQAGAHFGWLSENVIHGQSPEFIHAQFVKSPLHRANILDRDMDSIGIGVVEQGGELFVVEDFSQAR